MVNDGQPELGTVKWLGLMHDGLVAGVEFVSTYPMNPIHYK